MNRWVYQQANGQSARIGRVIWRNDMEFLPITKQEMLDRGIATAATLYMSLATPM